MPLVHNSYLHRVITNQERSFRASILRVGLRIAEFPYAGVTAVRNKLYDAKILRAHHLPIPVISIGNITAGGTGKTPFVRLLAKKLIQNNFHPAILMRGYKRTTSNISDEQLLLTDQLKELKIPVHANPNRVLGGAEILKNHPQTNIILLDDGFQHRRLFRDLDLVLIDATNPLGHNHIHPRGLLRESPAGLRRANAIILTRCEQSDSAQLEQITIQLRQFTSAPILRSRFLHTGLRSANTSISSPPDIALTSLKDQRIFATAAIANPTPFEASLGNPPHLWFPDHHDYTTSDLQEIRRRASAAGASAIITTEKDWVKLRSLPGALEADPPIYRLDLDIQLDKSDEDQLWSLLTSRIHRPK